MICFSVNPEKTHAGFYITFLIAGDQILLRHAWRQTVREGNERSTPPPRRTQCVRSKAISSVTGHVLHSFCAGDRHFFKGIVGTLFD